MFLRALIPIVTLAACSLITMPASAVRPDGGVRIHHDTIVAEGVDVYEPVFAPGVAHVVVRGDHDTDLDCFVVTNDFNEVIIAASEDSSDVCNMSFNMITTGNVRVKIYNLGQVYNDYTISFY